MSMRFDEVIATQERLREVSKAPSFRARNKLIDHVDAMCRRFIAACPFVASRGADGQIDVSLKGDPAGFVAVLDEKTLAIPDRLGNNRLDTFENLLAHAEIGLIFMIPGHGDTLRISGTGKIVRDSSLQARLAFDRKQPNLILVIGRGGVSTLPEVRVPLEAVEPGALAQSVELALSSSGDRDTRKIR